MTSRTRTRVMETSDAAEGGFDWGQFDDDLAPLAKLRQGEPFRLTFENVRPQESKFVDANGDKKMVPVVEGTAHGEFRTKDGPATGRCAIFASAVDLKRKRRLIAPKPGDEIEVELIREGGPGEAAEYRVAMTDADLADAGDERTAIAELHEPLE